MRRLGIVGLFRLWRGIVGLWVLRVNSWSTILCDVIRADVSCYCDSGNVSYISCYNPTYSYSATSTRSSSEPLWYVVCYLFLLMLLIIAVPSNFYLGMLRISMRRLSRDVVRGIVNDKTAFYKRKLNAKHKGQASLVNLWYLLPRASLSTEFHRLFHSVQ